MFNLPPSAIVFIVAMLPLSELRGAIPMAMGRYGFSPIEAYILGVTGNITPVFFLLFLLGPLERRLRVIEVFDRFFDHLFTRTRKNHGDRFDRYGALGLATFVAVPLPLTGAWSGVVAAYVFNIKKRYAFPAIVLGVLLAGVLVTLSTNAIVNGM